MAVNKFFETKQVSWRKNKILMQKSSFSAKQAQGQHKWARAQQKSASLLTIIESWWDFGEDNVDIEVICVQAWHLSLQWLPQLGFIEGNFGAILFGD